MLVGVDTGFFFLLEAQNETAVGVWSNKEIITSAQTFTEEKQTAHKSWVGAGLGFEILMGGNTYFFLEGRFNLLFADESTVFAPLKFGIIIK